MASKPKKNPECRVQGQKDGFPKGTVIWQRMHDAEAMEEGQDPSWSMAMRFDADTDIDVLRAAFKAACVDHFGSSKLPRKSKTCFLEGEDLADLIDEDKVPMGTEPDMVILKMRRKESFGPPQLWDEKVEPIENRVEFYSGIKAICDVEFFGWTRKNKSGAVTAQGVSCTVNGVQKLADGEPLSGGGANTQDSFGKIKMKGRKARDEDEDDEDEDEDVKPRRSRQRDEDDEDEAPKKRRRW